MVNKMSNILSGVEGVIDQPAQQDWAQSDPDGLQSPLLFRSLFYK